MQKQMSITPNAGSGRLSFDAVLKSVFFIGSEAGSAAGAAGRAGRAGSEGRAGFVGRKCFGTFVPADEVFFFATFLISFAFFFEESDDLAYSIVLIIVLVFRIRFFLPAFRKSAA